VVSRHHWKDDFALRKNPGVRESGQVIVLILIVLALVGGGVWWLFTSKRQSEEDARAFAQQAAQRLAIQFDRKFLDQRLGPEAQVQFPPSFRERLLNHLRDLGVPAAQIDLDGRVTFTSRFFEPNGQFRARLMYPEKPAFLDLIVSHPHALWQIDYLNLTYVPTPTPTPEPSPPLGVSPVPSASP
jgi:hypothetical protein